MEERGCFWDVGTTLVEPSEQKMLKEKGSFQTFVSVFLVSHWMFLYCIFTSFVTKSVLFYHLVGLLLFLLSLFWHYSSHQASLLMLTGSSALADH